MLLLEEGGVAGAEQYNFAAAFVFFHELAASPLQDVVHLDACGKHGGLLYVLGHEVRSLHHPGFMRPLYNRRDFEHQ